MVTPGSIAIDALKRRQQKALSEEMEPVSIPLAFPCLEGTLQRPQKFDRRVWHPIRKSADIPDDFKFRTLRHTQASLMIAAGVHLKVVQQRLRHSTFQLSADTYSHLMQGAQADAAQKVDRRSSMYRWEFARVHF